MLTYEENLATSILFSVFLLIAVVSYSSISPISAQEQSVPDPVIAEMISKIADSEIYDTAYHLQNFTTRRYGYSGNVEAVAYLYSKLESIPGLIVEYQGSYKNVIATLPCNNMMSKTIYIVGAHYDSTSSDQSYAPGVTDNGGGVGIVLEFARIMSQYSFNYTLKFAFWNAEETGALGSSDYAGYAYENSLDISLYMNFDSASYDPDNRLVLDLMYNDKSKWVSDMMTQYNSLYDIDFGLTYNAHTCASDHKPFWQHGYAATMTHAESHGPAHSGDDIIDRISTAYAKKNGQLTMSVLARLAMGSYVSPEINKSSHGPESSMFLIFLTSLTATLLVVMVYWACLHRKPSTHDGAQAHGIKRS